MGGNWNGESLMTDYNSDTMNFFSTFVVCLVILKWISLIVVAAIIAKLVTIILRWITVIKQCSLIPSPRTRPILGHIWDLLVPPKDLQRTITKLLQSVLNEPVFCLWLSYRPMIILQKHQAVEGFLVSPNNITKSDDYKMLSSWLGQGLLLSTGDKWSKHRKLLTPSFHFKILEESISIMNKQADVFVTKMESHVDKPFFRINEDVKLLTLDIICDCVMGKPINAQLNNDSDYVKAVQGAGELFIYRGARPWLYPQWIFNLTSAGRRQNSYFKTMRQFVDQVIKEKRKILSLNGHQNNSVDKRIKKPMAFLELLMNATYDDGTCLTDKEIQDEANTFMFAGHDTSAAAITWVLYLLGRHPTIQQAAWEEINSVIGNSDKELMLSDLSKLVYLEAVIKESMRLYPPVPIIGRTLEDDTEVCGYQIPKGVTVAIGINLMHYDEGVFPDAKEFNPTRFLNDKGSERSPFAYIPFSAGLRNCIGQKFGMLETKVVLSKFLRRLKVLSRDKSEDLKITFHPVLENYGGIYARLERRS